MGDVAEGVYESVRPLGKTHRFGWRRPKGISMKNMPSVLRHMPDFYADGGYLVEVMGLGKDGILKSLKPEKWEALKMWNRFASNTDMKLVFFIWNSYSEEYVVLTWDKVVPLVAKAKRKGVVDFGDGGTYYPVPWSDIQETAPWVGKWHTE